MVHLVNWKASTFGCVFEKSYVSSAEESSDESSDESFDEKVCVCLVTKIGAQRTC